VTESRLRSPQSALLAPQSRYVLPSFVERTSYGIKEMNPYNKLFEERIIFLGVQIDDASANDVMAQLLTLEAIDPDRDITMYINSPGGSMTSMMAIYDTMQFIQPDITTCCIGQAASAAAVLLAAGTKGKRMALPNSRILIHQPATEGGYGQSTDMEIQAREILRMRAAMEVILARHTGKDEEEVRRDIERDKFLTAEGAKEYGLIDEVLTMIKRGSERAVEVMSSLPGENSALPSKPAAGFDGVHRAQEAVPSIRKLLTAPRDTPARGGQCGRPGRPHVKEYLGGTHR
jgi:ATP-dependent Clp protease, protease subunit